MYVTCEYIFVVSKGNFKTFLGSKRYYVTYLLHNVLFFEHIHVLPGCRTYAYVGNMPGNTVTVVKMVLFY